MAMPATLAAPAAAADASGDRTARLSFERERAPEDDPPRSIDLALAFDFPRGEPRDELLLVLRRRGVQREERDRGAVVWVLGPVPLHEQEVVAKLLAVKAVPNAALGTNR